MTTKDDRAPREHRGIATESNEKQDAPSVSILGVKVHNVALANVGFSVEKMIESGTQHQIIPVNPEMVMAAQTNTYFLEAINNASLVLADGIGVVLASRIFGNPIQQRVTGVDAVHQIADLARRKQLRVFLLGAATGIAEQAAERLQRQHPGLEVAGTYAGSPHPDEEDDICRRINSTNPDILLIAYGAPKQELWVARNLHKLPVRLAMCVGGTFDFLAGVSVRAPKWIQSIGFEWLYRLAKEPHRWRRMLALPRFALAVIGQRVLSRS